MKKFIISCLLTVCMLTGLSQSVINRTFGTNTVNDPRLSASLNFLPPRYVDTTAANLSIGIDTCGALIFTYAQNTIWTRGCNPKRWVRIVQTGDIAWGSITGTIANQTDLQNYFIQNQYAVKQTANSYYDSTRLGNLFLSRRGGTDPSIYSTNKIWYMTSSIRHMFSGWDANEYAMIFFTTFNNNQSNTYSGVINGFNFSNSGTTNKPLVISTSGFSNLRAGDIIISTGRDFFGDTIRTTKINVPYNVILDPSGTGEVQATRVMNFEGGWKTNDSISSSTTITITTARAVWIFTGSSTATWTLPALAGNTDVTFFIKNKGSADIVLTAGTNEIYSSAATTTFNITAGQGYMVRNDGTNWTILNN